MFNMFRNWRENRRIKKMGLTAEQWESAIADWPVMARYQGIERAKISPMGLILNSALKCV